MDKNILHSRRFNLQILTWILLSLVIFLLLYIGVPIIADAEEWFVNATKIILIVLGLGLGLIEIRRLNRRLATLAGVAEKIGEGDYEARAEVGRQDSVGILANTLNLMASRIAQSINALETSESNLRLSKEELSEKNNQLLEAYRRQTFFGKFLSTLNAIRIERIIGRSMPYILEISNAQVGVFYLFQEDKQKLVRIAERGIAKAFVNQLGPKETLDGLPGEVYSRQQATLIQDLQGTPLGKIDLGIGETPIQYAFGLPVSFQNKAIGVLILAGIKPLQEDIREALKNYIGALAQSLSNALAYQLVNQQIGDIKESNSRLQQINKEKNDFVNTLSHELRTPLNSIIGFSRIINENSGDKLPFEEQDRLQRIGRNARRLLNMINDMLDFSKIEAGHVGFEVNDFSLNEVGKDVIETLQPLADAKGLELVLDFPGPEITAHSDEAKIRQILINLVGNAIKFTNRGRVTLSLTEDPMAEDLVYLEVIDTGIGISPKLQESLFQPYHRGQDSTSEGTGLGLAISKSYAEQIGGNLSLRSKEGQGSTFTLELPLLHGKVHSAADSLPGSPSTFEVLPPKNTQQGETAKPSSDPEKPILQESNDPLYIQRLEQILSEIIPLKKGQTVLVVDDDEDTRSIICDYLEDMGLLPIPLADSTQLVADAEKKQPQLITLDLSMPIKNGWVALRELRESKTCQDIPVLILSIHEKQSRRIPQLKAETLPKTQLHNEFTEKVRSVITPGSALRSHALLVCAEPTAKEILVPALTERVGELDCATNAEDAIEKAKVNRPDFILLAGESGEDEAMPLLDYFVDHFPTKEIPPIVSFRKEEGHSQDNPKFLFEKVFTAPDQVEQG
ncbi:MAG: response regulator [Opitutales bacterium]|nr:response regulator [Opitutales bacterium]MCH8541238.1 response regulator [Opitutales bacterium]